MGIEGLPRLDLQEYSTTVDSYVKLGLVGIIIMVGAGRATFRIIFEKPSSVLNTSCRSTNEITVMLEFALRSKR